VKTEKRGGQKKKKKRGLRVVISNAPPKFDASVSARIDAATDKAGSSQVYPEGLRKRVHQTDVLTKHRKKKMRTETLSLGSFFLKQGVLIGRSPTKGGCRNFFQDRHDLGGVPWGIVDNKNGSKKKRAWKKRCWSAYS